MYYLFTSNARPLYIQDALNILALPCCAIYQFRYDKEYVQESLLEDMEPTGSLERAQNKEALVVFVTQADEIKPNEAVHYYPLRKVSIRSMKLEGRIVCIRFELGNYVCWKESSCLDQDSRDEKIKAALDEPLRPRRKYVVQDALPTDSLFRFADTDRATAAWQYIVEVINPLTCFKRTVFYRIGGVYEYKEKFISKFLNLFRREKQRDYRKKQHRLASEVLAEMSGYMFSSDTTNMLHLDFYHVDSEETQFEKLVDENVSIIPKYDTAYFSYSPKPIPVSARYDDYPIPLIVSSLNADVFTEVEIALDEGGVSEKIGRAAGGPPAVAVAQNRSPEKPEHESVLRAPNVCLVLKLEYPRRALALQFVLLFITQFITALSGSIAEFLTLFGYSDAIVGVGQLADLVLSVCGPLATAFLLFLLFRRMPVGSK